MKRTFQNVNEMHQYIERQAKKTIKFYYTDWKHYDRPEIMKATANKSILYIILRECGSYAEKPQDLKNYHGSRVIMDYYKTDKTAKYYKLDFQKLTVESIAAGLPEEYKKYN